MLKRLITATALLAIFLPILWIGGWLLAGFVSIVLLICGYEWARLFKFPRPMLAMIWISATAVYGNWVLALGFGEEYFVWIFIVIILSLLFGYQSLRYKMFQILGMIYIALPAISFWLLWLNGKGAGLILWLVVIVIATDSCAYFAGRLIGGPKLLPKISPKKTWSGFAGGMSGGVFLGYIMARHIPEIGFPDQLNPIVIAAVIAIFSVVGDLVESGIKRWVGVKDSGNILPGHGGVLDRLDGYMLALPVGCIFILQPFTIL